MVTGKRAYNVGNGVRTVPITAKEFSDASRGECRRFCVVVSPRSDVKSLETPIRAAKRIYAEHSYHTPRPRRTACHSGCLVRFVCYTQSQPKPLWTLRCRAKLVHIGQIRSDQIRSLFNDLDLSRLIYP